MPQRPVPIPAALARLHVLRNHRLAGPTPEAATGAGAVIEVTRDLVGLHATAATTPYLSVAARWAGFRCADLDHELYETYALLRLRCMRGTVFMLPRDLACVAVAATHRRAMELSRRFMLGQGLSEDEYASWRKRILRLLHEQGPLTARAIRDQLVPPASLSPVINLMCDELVLLRGRPAGGWRDLQYTYVPAEAIWPRSEWEGINPVEAVGALVRTYVGAYGPVTLDDIAWWAGLPRRAVAAGLAALAGEVVEVVVSGEDAPPRVMLAAEYERALELGAGRAEGGEEPAAHLLPALDPIVMGYHGRAHYLDDEYLEFAFDRAGNGTSVVLYRGRIAGVWDALTDPRPAVGVWVFPGYPAAEIMAALEAPAARVGELVFGQAAPLMAHDSMVPLTRRPAGWVAKPLHEKN